MLSYIYKMWLLFLWYAMVNKIPNLIRNIDAPSCVDCVHFIKYESNAPYDPRDLQYGKCKIFGAKDKVSGIINYDYASICRGDNKCGTDGKYFKAKNVNSTK